MAASLSCWSYCNTASCMLVFAINLLIHFVCTALSIKSRIDSSMLHKTVKKNEIISEPENSSARVTTHPSNSRMFSNSDWGASSHFPSMRRPSAVSRRAARCARRKQSCWLVLISWRVV
jgi:hypothetical protein